MHGISTAKCCGRKLAWLEVGSIWLPARETGRLNQQFQSDKWFSLPLNKLNRTSRNFSGSPRLAYNEGSCKCYSSQGPLGTSERLHEGPVKIMENIKIYSKILKIICELSHFNKYLFNFRRKFWNIFGMLAENFATNLKTKIYNFSTQQANFGKWLQKRIRKNRF